MSKADKQRLCDEIDVFLTAPKRLLGPQPIWRTNGHDDRLDATWLIEEYSGVTRSYLAFRLNRLSTGEPSVSLIYESRPVCRVDIKPPEEEDGNPPQARKFGLPGKVYGPHIHRWLHNKQYVLDALPPDEWEIPIKEPISHLTQTLGHILAMICEHCAVEFTPEQRDVAPPTRMGLI